MFRLPVGGKDVIGFTDGFPPTLDGRCLAVSWVYTVASLAEDCGLSDSEVWKVGNATSRLPPLGSDGLLTLKDIAAGNMADNLWNVPTGAV